MNAGKFRADYERLEEIAQQFGCASDDTRRMLQALESCVDVLMYGDWVGVAATRFYHEMITSVLPSVKRLADAQQHAAQATRRIVKIAKQAEDDCAALFKVVPSGVEAGSVGERARAPEDQGDPLPQDGDAGLPPDDGPPPWAPLVVLPAQALDWYNRTVNQFIYDRLNNVGAGLRAWPGVFDLGGKIAAYYGAQGWFWYHKNVNERLYSIPGTLKTLGFLTVYGLWRASQWAETLPGISNAMAEMAVTSALRDKVPVMRPPTVNPPGGPILLNGFTSVVDLGKFAQDQAVPVDLPTGCAPYATAAVINILYGTNITGETMTRYFEGQGGVKTPWFGTLPLSQPDALDRLFYLANPDQPAFDAIFTTGGTRNDLLDNLNNGYLTIVNISFGGDISNRFNGVGHAMVLVGYDPTDPTGPKYIFLDSREAAGSVTRIDEAVFNQQWLNQPNTFIPSGSMITIMPVRPNP